MEGQTYRSNLQILDVVEVDGKLRKNKILTMKNQEGETIRNGLVLDQKKEQKT